MEAKLIYKGKYTTTWAIWCVYKGILSGIMNAYYWSKCNVLLNYHWYQFSSVVSDSLPTHGLQHTRLPWPSPTPRAYKSAMPSNHPASVVPFSSSPQSFPLSGAFPMSQFFASGSQSIGVSALASVLPMNIQDWFPWGGTGWISSQSKRLSRVFSNTTIQEHQFFSAQFSL